MAYFCCRKVRDGDLMFVHRFIQATEADEGDNDDGAWAGRIKMITTKQNQIITTVQEMKDQMAALDGRFEKVDKIEQLLKKQFKL